MSYSAPQRLCDSVWALCLLHYTLAVASMGISQIVCGISNIDFNHDLKAIAYMLFLLPQCTSIFTVSNCDIKGRGTYRAMKSCAVRLAFSIICTSGCLGALSMSCTTLSFASIMCLALIPAIILVWSIRKLCKLWRLVFYDIKDCAQDRADFKWGVTKWILRKWRKLSSLLHLRDRCSMKWEFVIEVGFKSLSWVLIWALIYFAIYMIHIART